MLCAWYTHDAVYVVSDKLQAITTGYDMHNIYVYIKWFLSLHVLTDILKM